MSVIKTLASWLKKLLGKSKQYIKIAGKSLYLKIKDTSKAAAKKAGKKAGEVAKEGAKKGATAAGNAAWNAGEWTGKKVKGKLEAELVNGSDVPAKHQSSSGLQKRRHSEPLKPQPATRSNGTKRTQQDPITEIRIQIKNGKDVTSTIQQHDDLTQEQVEKKLDQEEVARWGYNKHGQNLAPEVTSELNSGSSSGSSQSSSGESGGRPSVDASSFSKGYSSGSSGSLSSSTGNSSSSSGSSGSSGTGSMGDGSMGSGNMGGS
jgi:hypothetical protein